MTNQQAFEEFLSRRGEKFEPSDQDIRTLGELVIKCKVNPKTDEELRQLWRAINDAAQKYWIFKEAKPPTVKAKKQFAKVRDHVTALGALLREPDVRQGLRAAFATHYTAAEMNLIAGGVGGENPSFEGLQNALSTLQTAVTEAQQSLESPVVINIKPKTWLIGTALPAIGYRYLEVGTVSQTIRQDGEHGAEGDLVVFVEGAMKLIGVGTTGQSVRVLIQRARSNANITG